MKEEIQQTRLENGCVVLTDRMPGVRSATLGFFFRVGSRHEPEELNGISHFIEHTVFKGTANRSALDIAIEQDRLGGNRMRLRRSRPATGRSLRAAQRLGHCRRAGAGDRQPGHPAHLIQPPYERHEWRHGHGDGDE